MHEELKQFGLNLYERQAYDLLIKEGALTAYIIAKKSSVPSGKIYPVLDSLIKKGFASLLEGRPKMYVGISPEIAFEKVVKKKTEELSSIQNNAKRLINNYSKIRNFKEEKKEELVETYFGHSTSFARSITLHNQTKKYWKTISNLTLNKEHLEACSQAIKRGIKILALTNPYETTEEKVKQWRKRGIEIKFLKELPFRLSIYDDKGVVFRLSHEKTKEYVSVHIINTKLAHGMSKLFDSLWLIATKDPSIPLKKQ